MSKIAKRSNYITQKSESHFLIHEFFVNKSQQFHSKPRMCLLYTQRYELEGLNDFLLDDKPPAGSLLGIMKNNFPIWPNLCRIPIKCICCIYSIGLKNSQYPNSLESYDTAHPSHSLQIRRKGSPYSDDNTIVILSQMKTFNYRRVDMQYIHLVML